MSYSNSSKQLSVPHLTAVIADDEPLPRLHLQRLLEEQGVTILGQAGDVQTTFQMVEQLHPELLFLDIQMPQMTGMQMATILRSSDNAPLVIFVTGYSEYAAEAFEVAAFDYLLKPTSAERITQTLTRARQLLAPSPGSAREEIPETPLPIITAPLRRIPIRLAYSIQFVRVEQVNYIEARQKAVYVHLIHPSEEDDGEEGLRVNFSLSQLETLLTHEFIRIHDSYIVPLERVVELIFLGNHSYSVRLDSGQVLPVGRSRYPALRERLGLESPG